MFLHEGKGPQKEKYEEKLRMLRLKCVAFCTMWLSAEDYPRLLGDPYVYGCFISIAYTLNLLFFLGYEYTSSCSYRINRSWCVFAYFFVGVGSSNEGIVKC